MTDSVLPNAVYTIWWIGLLVTLVVFVPLAVYLLHRTWRAARSIQWYAAEALTAAAGIAGNTKYVPALDDTIGVASQMLGVADGIVNKLDTAATVLAERAE
jgi:hypothetical protein